MMISTNSTRVNDHYLFIALLMLIVWIPIPHASEAPWAYSLFGTLTFMLLSISLLMHWNNNRALPKVISLNKLPICLLITWLIFQFIQTVGLPEQLLEVISPTAKTVHDYTNAGGGQNSSTLTITPDHTLAEFIKNCSYIAIFLLVLILTHSQKRLKQLVIVLFSVGALQSLYSLLNYSTLGAYSLIDSQPPWDIVNNWGKTVRGTYSHYNHFAGLLEMTIPLGIGLLFARASPNSHQGSSKHFFVKIIEFLMSSRAFTAAIFLISLTALFFTGSRGGNGAFYISFIIASLSVIIFRGIKSRETTILLTISFFILVVSIWTGMGSVSNRLNDLGLQENGRDLSRVTAYKIISDYPLFGSGAGSYKNIRTTYTDSGIGSSPMYSHVHMDYLELISDQGIIGFSILGASLLLIIIKIVSAIRRNQLPLITGILFGVLIGVMAMLIHANVELNFYIPANAVYFYILLAIGLIASSDKASDSEHA